MDTQRKLLLIAGILGTTAVILGAFGAHALKKIFEEANRLDLLESYKTGVEYQYYHTVAIFAIALSNPVFQSKWLSRAAWCFALGTLLFSGSIYLLSCRDILGVPEGMRAVLGPITPIGGTVFIVGWVMVIVAALKKN